jgi:hypothetical protein
MPITLTTDIYDPQTIIAGVAEQTASYPALFNSPAIAKGANFDEWAALAGTTITIPFLRNITNIDEEVQIEDTAPSTNNISESKQNAIPINRVLKFGISAAAQHTSANDPLGTVISQIAESRLFRSQKQILSLLTGAFGVTALSNALLKNYSVSTGTPAAANLIDADKIIAAAASLGERVSTLKKGVVWAHPIIIAALRSLDNTAFQRASEGDITIETYLGLPIFASNSLTRAVNGQPTLALYDTYIIADASIGYGEAPQIGGFGGPETIGLATLNVKADVDKNNIFIFDRTRQLPFINGLSWKATIIPGVTPGNADLANSANWDYVFTDPELLGAVKIVTNG